jgi:hypothetical protein
MLDALIQGTTGPQILAELARGPMRTKIPALKEALAGRFEHLQPPCGSARSSSTSTSSTGRSPG